MDNNSEINENYHSEKSIIKAISENSSEVGIDLLEVLIDDLTQDLLNEVANNIPITKIINSLRKTGLSISDYVFMRKLAQFLTGVQDIDESIRKKIQKSSFDEKAKKELIEKIIIAIERLDEIKKADGLFKIFIAYTTGEINQS